MWTLMNPSKTLCEYVSPFLYSRVFDCHDGGQPRNGCGFRSIRIKQSRKVAIRVRPIGNFLLRTLSSTLQKLCVADVQSLVPRSHRRTVYQDTASPAHGLRLETRSGHSSFIEGKNSNEERARWLCLLLH